MTTGELKEILNSYPDDTLIVMSSDVEGNSYSPLGGYSGEYVYIADSKWSGEIMLKELTPELENQGYSEEDVYGYTEWENEEPETGGVSCVVLWPIN